MDRSGVVDALSKSLVKLYCEPEKPYDAVRFVRKYLCEECPDEAQFEALKTELNKLRAENQKLHYELDTIKSNIERSPDEVAQLLEENYKSMQEDDKCNSLLKKYLTRDILDEYKSVTTEDPYNSNLYDCCVSGFENHDSKVGIYAADASCYEVFNRLFDPIIRDYHEVDEGEEQEDEILHPDVNWGDPDTIDNIDPEMKYIVSTRIRLARNLEDEPLFSKMKEENFKELAEKIVEFLLTLEGELAGTYLSFEEISMEEQKEMVNRFVGFERGNRFLESAGCYRFWPAGRGVFKNENETFLVWTNEEDHMRIISKENSGNLGMFLK